MEISNGINVKVKYLQNDPKQGGVSNIKQEEPPCTK